MKEILSNEKIDLILLDINLPGEDGIQLTREVRNTSDIAIIMVTGRTDPIDRILGLEMGGPMIMLPSLSNLESYWYVRKTCYGEFSLPAMLCNRQRLHGHN